MPILKPNQFAFFAYNSQGNEVTKYLMRDSILGFTKKVNKYDDLYVDSVLPDTYKFSVQTKDEYYEILVEGADKFRNLSDRFQGFWENYSSDTFELKFQLNPDLFK